MRISRNDKIFSLLNVYLPYKYDLNLDKFNDYLAKLYVHIAEMSSTCITTVGYFNPSIASVALEGYIYVWVIRAKQVAILKVTRGVGQSLLVFHGE